MIVASIDIGSTWTKGALFQLDDADLVIQRRAECPTTLTNLADGFFRVLSELVGGRRGVERVLSGDTRLVYSASAKGGLAVAALGLVPSLTLESAKLAAYCAGAKLTGVLSYRLTLEDMTVLEQAPPDILLFAGGTDGGNTAHPLHNAQMLARSKLACPIIYAGNRSVRDEVSVLLRDKDFVAVDNLLPELDVINVEPARQAIRAIFLAKIVHGKGLHFIVQQTGVEPVPTPYAMYDYASHIRAFVPGWSEFTLIDIGGATTDVYSAHREVATGGVVRRGLPEPDVKRTVEGDLGLRVSAAAAAESSLLAAALGHDERALANFAAYVARVSAEPGYLAQEQLELEFDAILAGVCLAHGYMRHAGRTREVATRDGMLTLQTGSDLSNVSKMIGSGGWLSKNRSFDPARWLSLLRVDEAERPVLLPTRIDYYHDKHHLFPLLANAARVYPAAAARAGIRSLVSANTTNHHDD